jgi:S-adenosylmethionine uptake transporter
MLAGLSPARRGALIYVISGLVFVASDSLTKALVADLPVLHVVFGRSLGYVVLVSLIGGGRQPGRLLPRRRLGLQVARGLTMFGATATFFLSLSLLPMAEVSTLGSTTPLIIVCLAGPLLGERVTRSAWVGAVIGFAGVLALVGLDPSHLDPAVIFPLASALSFALFSMLTRVMSTESPTATVFVSGLVALVASLALEVVVDTPTSPTAIEWAATAVIGLGSLAGHRLLVGAFRYGRASDLAPLGYLSVVWAFLAGAIVFGEAVQLRAVLGALAIAMGGVLALRGATRTEVVRTPAPDDGVAALAVAAPTVEVPE